MILTQVRKKEKKCVSCTVEQDMFLHYFHTGIERGFVARSKLRAFMVSLKVADSL